MLWTFMQIFSFIPLMASEKIFYFFFFLENLAFWLPWQPIKISDLDKIQMVGRGLLQKHFCKNFFKVSAVRNTEINANFHFSLYKSMEVAIAMKAPGQQ